MTAEPELAASPPQGTTWFSRGVAGIGGASLLADVGHEVPTALLPSLLTATLGAPASALGLIEGVSPSWAFAYLTGWMILAAAILNRQPPRPELASGSGTVIESDDSGE